MKRIVTKLMLLAAMALPAASFAQGDCNDPLPWNFDFEGLTTGGSSFAPCWTRVNASVSGSAQYPNIYYFNATQGNVMNFNGNFATEEGTMRAATPLIPAPLNQIEVHFWVKNSTLKLYAATDPTNQSTYHLIGSYAPGTATEGQVYEVRTDQIAGIPSSNGYLVFTANYGSGYGNDNPYLDDVYIGALNGCERTEFVRINNITPYTADLAWPGIDGRQGYRVSYSDVDDFANATSFDVPANSASLSGLTPGTVYYVWVQTICDDENISDPRPATFTTQDACYPILKLKQVGYSSDIAAFQWEYDGRGNEPNGGVLTILRDLTDPTVEDVVETSSGPTYHFFTGLDPEHEYLAIFRTLCDNDSAEAVTRYVVMHHCGESEVSFSPHTDYSKDFPLNFAYKHSFIHMLYPASVVYDMDTIRGIAVRRDTAAGQGEATRHISVWLGNSTATSTTASTSVAGMTHVFSGYHFFPHREWDTLLFTTPFVYDGHSNVKVIIVDSTGSSLSLSATPSWVNHDAEWKTYYNFNETTDYNPTSLYGEHQMMKLPDMRFVGACHEGVCGAPVTAVTNVDSTFVELEWIGGMAEDWVVEYRSNGATEWIVADTTPWTTYILEGLMPSSYYEIRVGAVCADGNRYTQVINIVTGCAFVHIPFHFTQNDMLAAVANGFTPCWNWSQYFFRHRLTDSNRGTVYNSGNDEWFMLPAVAEPLQGARLRTWVASSDQGWFKVGIANESNCSDVVWIDTIEVLASNVNTSHDEKISYLDTYTGNGHRVVVSPIVNNNYHFMYFFDFHLEPIEGCRPPVNLTLDSANANTLYVSWRPVGESSEWAVYVGGVRRGTTNEPHFTISGLNAYTYYNVQVRTLCGEDSSAVTSANFLTDCEGESCYFTIVARSVTGDGWRGGHLVTEAGTMTYDFTMLRGHATEQSCLVCNSDSVKFLWYSGNDDEVCSFNIIGPAGDTLYTAATAYNLPRNFFALDSLCGRAEPGPGPGVAIEVAEAAAITLAPNPASSMFTLAGVENGSTVSLIDACGRMVMHTMAATKRVDINVEGLAKGVYFVRIANGKAVVTKKVIVK